MRRSSTSTDFMRHISPLGKCNARLDIPVPGPLLDGIKSVGKGKHTDWSREVLEKAVAGHQALAERRPAGEAAPITLPGDRTLLDDITAVARMRGSRDPIAWLLEEVQKLVAGELVVMQRRINGPEL